MAINYEKTALRWYDNAKKLGIALPAKGFFTGLIYQYNNGENVELAKAILSPLRGNPAKQIVIGEKGAYFRPIQISLQRLNAAINADRQSAASGLNQALINQMGLNFRDTKIENVSAQNMARRLTKGYYYGVEGYAQGRINKYLHDYKWILGHYFLQPYGQMALDIIEGWPDSKLIQFILSNSNYDYDGLYLIDSEDEWLEFIETIEEYE